ncbi:MAG: conjugal transfer protein TraF [Candidatus Krumholzibacteriia bacterium]
MRPRVAQSVRSWSLGAVCLGLLAGPAGAYFELVDTSSRALAFGNAYVALATDVSGVAWNPGGLGAIDRYELQASVSRPYFVPDLVSNAVLIGGPAFAGGLGAGWHRLGNEFLSENLWFLSYGRWVYRDDHGVAHVGGALKIARVGVAAGPRDYGSVTVVTGDVGLLYQSRHGFSLGGVVRNLGEPEIEFVDGGGSTALDRGLDLGAAYRWRPESTVSGGWTSDGRSRDAWRLGGEIWFYDVFAVRLGVLGTEFAGGFGLKSRRWMVDSSFVTHPQLGLSGRITLTLPLGVSR